MRITRSTSMLGLSSLPADSTENMPQRKNPEEQRLLRRRKTSPIGDAVLERSGHCWISRGGKTTDDGMRASDHGIMLQTDLMQKKVQSVTRRSTKKDEGHAGCTLATGKEHNTTAISQPKSEKRLLTGISNPVTADFESLAGTKYNLRRSKIFTSSERPQDFECLLKSYYDSLFTDSDTEEKPTCDMVPRYGHKTLFTEEATDFSSDQYALRDGLSMPQSNTYSVLNAFCDSNPSGDNTPLTASFMTQKSRGIQLARDSDSRIKGMRRSCLRNRDHSDKMLCDRNSDQAETFDYVLKSNRCLLKQKRSFIEKLTQGFQGVLRPRRNSQENTHVYSQTCSLDDAAFGSKRRVSFREPEVRRQEVCEDEEVTRSRPRFPSCGMELSCEGLSTDSEEVSEVKDATLWSRSTTMLLSIVVGLRILLDAWSGHFDIFHYVNLRHLFGNKSSDQ